MGYLAFLAENVRGVGPPVVQGANPLAEGQRTGILPWMPNPGASLAANLAANTRHLRDRQNLTQQQLATRSGVPRATLANLESGSANPTLAVLHKIAVALQVSVEELISAPRSTTRHVKRDALKARQKGAVVVRNLLPDPIPGISLERFELPPRARFVGVPHNPGTREYLTCERGTLILVVAAERLELAPGDVATFRGDQRHSYLNDSSSEAAVGYSVVLYAGG